MFCSVLSTEVKIEIIKIKKLDIIEKMNFEPTFNSMTRSSKGVSAYDSDDSRRA